jgi:hypothetical protein
MSALVGEIELRPESGFELSLRGYHRAQVDRYLATLQMRLTTAETELASSRYREQQLTGRIDRLGAELQKCTCAEDESTARMVGGRIQRMIQLAEEESTELRQQAEHDLQQARGQADAVIAEARLHAEEAMRDFQNVLAQRRSEEARAEAGRRMQWDARRQRQREEAEEVLANTRALSADGLALTRRLLDALAEQHATLCDEVQIAEKTLANLSGV